MKNKTILFMLAVCVSQAFTFLSFLLYVSFLTPSVYASVAIFETVLAFLQSSMGLALDRSVQRFYVDHDGNKVVSVAAGGTLMVSVFVFIIFLTVTWVFGAKSYRGVERPEFIGLYIAATGYILHSIVLVKFQFSSKPKSYFIASLAKTASFFLLSAMFLFQNRSNSLCFIYSQVVTGGLLIILSVTITKPVLINKSNFLLMKEMLIYSLPFIPRLIVAWIVQWSNRLFMSGYISDSDLGNYAAAHRLAMVFFIFTQTVNLVAVPILYQKLEEKDNNGVVKIIKDYWKVYFLLASLIVVFMPNISSKFLNPEYKNITIFFSVVMFANYVNVLYVSSITVIFNYLKKTYLQMKMGLCTAPIALACYALLIPQYKITGIIFSLLIPAFVGFFAHLYFVKKVIPFAFPILTIFANLSAFAGMCMLSVLVENLNLTIAQELLIKLLTTVSIGILARSYLKRIFSDVLAM